MMMGALGGSVGGPCLEIHPQHCGLRSLTLWCQETRWLITAQDPRRVDKDGNEAIGFRLCAYRPVWQSATGHLRFRGIFVSGFGVFRSCWFEA